MSNTHESVSLAAAIALRAQVLLLQASFSELNALANLAISYLDAITDQISTARAVVADIKAPADIQLNSLNKELIYLDTVIKSLGGA